MKEPLDKVERGDIADAKGGVYLGIDAGSTTTKLALIGESGELLFSYYRSNNGNPIETAMEAMGEVTGATVREDITARIFERFCVGK